MAPVLEFHYDLSCPYAYLASTQVRALSARTGATLSYRPFLLGGVFKALSYAGMPLDEASAARIRMNELDMRRWAEHWGVPLVRPRGHPNRTVLALRALLGAPEAAWPGATHALFAAYWERGEDVSDPAVVQAALDAAGLDGAALVSTADERKDELRRRTDEAIARGVFGAPTFFVGDELFWGQDRLHLVERELRKGRTDTP